MSTRVFLLLGFFLLSPSTLPGLNDRAPLPPPDQEGDGPQPDSVGTTTSDSFPQSGGGRVETDCGLWTWKDEPFSASLQADESCQGNGGQIRGGATGGVVIGGTGFAADASVLCDIVVQNAGQGVSLFSAEYVPDPESGCQGHISGSAYLRIEGRVTLSGDSEAYALGSASWNSNWTMATAAINLEHSQGSTGQSQVGTVNIPYHGGSASIPISVITGGGTRRDMRQNAVAGSKCTNFATHTRSLHGALYFGADGWVLSPAASNGRVRGRVLVSDLVLDDCVQAQ